MSLCIYSDVLLQPRDLPLGSHFIIIGVNAIIIYFSMYMYVNDFRCVKVV